MATATSKATEILLTCPECGQTCGMKIDTADLSVVECGECGETIDPSQAAGQLREAAARWDRFAEWLAAAAMV